MTVKELAEKLATCQPSTEVVVPCLGCGDAEAESTLINNGAYVLIMCKVCADGERHDQPR
jgi:hypothetical protein